MIDNITEQFTSTYNAPAFHNQSIMALYAGANRLGAAPSTSVVLLGLDEPSNPRFDYVVTSGSYPQAQLWNFPIAEGEALIKPRKLSLIQAQELALKALESAEARRKREREAEAKFWADLD